MTRFAGVVGYGESQEVPPGSGDYKEVITERTYFGRVVRNSRRIQAEGKVNFDLSLQNSIEIVADAYARDNMEKLRYVMWRGKRWIVDEITDQPPRLVLRLGELYNGTIPEVVPDVPAP
jgi:CYTH domain-containing protein